MNTSNNKEAFELSPEELAQLGNGALSYIREIEGRDVIRLVGPQARGETRCQAVLPVQRQWVADIDFWNPPGGG